MLNRGVCIVLGGAKGVGRRCVEKWIKSGRQVAYMDIDKASGKALKAELDQKYEADVFFFHGDVNDEEDREIFRSVVLERYGRIDCFLNNISSHKKMDHKSNAS